MSKRRPGERDMLEARLLALAAGRSMTQEEFIRECTRLQRLLDIVETRRLHSRSDEECDRYVGDDGRTAEEREEVAPYDGDWRAKAASAIGLLRGMVRYIALHKQPGLAAGVARLALDEPACPSGRELAEAFRLSPERVSQLLEEVQNRFSLPKNSNNKSASAVMAYRAAAQNRNAA